MLFLSDLRGWFFRRRFVLRGRLNFCFLCFDFYRVSDDLC
ncbi:hypothetical protein NEIFL0001_0140 [Neisseria flavescens SK114]|nr:hypothetical protein NEIFL0001_0140 [Neisseria flavescens SK114]